MSEQKTMQFANFNVTFGESEEAMLTHFEDIIYPAFTANLVRGGEKDKSRYSFVNVEIKEINGEYVLVGDFVKDTQYDIHTLYKNNELISAPSVVPTSPYSRFIVFLNNHRMVLILNESHSPNIRSFQSTVRSILEKYTFAQNSKIKNEKDQLPSANVNIVDIPLKSKVDDALKDVDKITEFRLSFFPLNNDLDPEPLAQYIESDMNKLGSRRANLAYLSPQSKENIVDMVNKIGDLAIALIKTKNKDGSKKSFGSEVFRFFSKVTHDKNITEDDDSKFVDEAKKTGMIKEPSPANKNLYDRSISIFRKLIKKISK